MLKVSLTIFMIGFVSSLLWEMTKTSNFLGVFNRKKHIFPVNIMIPNIRKNQGPEVLVIKKEPTRFPTIYDDMKNDQKIEK